ncbi:MOSC domain-containing protein [Microbaculum marinum]|uniref:MOSC domain-containing protein n=1 Tax=Microbaculum marinum TaxID=1764581 RepID=A0AAW9RJI7_9HYPH
MRGRSVPNATIDAIYRYPVKGLSAERLESVSLSPGEALPFDRAWAIENGPSGFDRDQPSPLPKIKFLMLMKNERLAALETRFDEETSEFEIFRHGKRVAGGKLDEPLGRQLIEQFFAAYSAEDLRGAPKILAAPGHTFSDVGKRVVSIASMASLRDLERVAAQAIHPLRFRANLYVEGWQPWQEFDFVGREIELGNAAVVKVLEPIVRCAATNVDPETGNRDMQIPRLLSGAFAHSDFGIYAEVVEGGPIETGAPVVVRPD